MDSIQISKTCLLLLCIVLTWPLRSQIIESYQDNAVPKEEERTVSGKVLYENAKGELEPMRGVHVVVKGTHRGTTTDTLGAYKIKVTGNDILTYSFISMRNEERLVGFNSSIDVVLQDDQFNLNDVVIVGHLPIQKRHMQSSVSMVKKDDINLQPVSNALSSMQGRIAGANVLNTTGISNSVFTRIRGNSSYLASNDPLYLYEGMPIVLDYPQGVAYNGHIYRPQLDFSPLTVGSIEVIRDAATGSIYGSRAAKGVVQIKAPKGKPGKPQITFSQKAGLAEPVTRKFQPLDTAGYFEFLDDLAPTLGSPNINDHRDLLLAAGIPKSQYHANTDWRDEVFKNGYFLENQLTLSGGNEDQQYYLGLGTQRMNGVIHNHGRNKNDLIFNYQLQASDRLDVSLISLINNINYDASLTGEHIWSQLRAAYLLPPHLQPYDDDGQTIENFAVVRLDNPAALADEEFLDIDLSNNRLLGVLDLDYRLSSNFALKYKGGIDVNQWQEDIFSSKRLMFGTDHGQAIAIRTTFQSQLHEGSVHFKKLFSDHQVEASAGVSYTTNEADAVGAFGFGAHSRKLSALSNIGGNPFLQGVLRKRKLLSYFSNVFYQYQNRFFLTGSFRYDGSSDLAPGHQYSGFWGLNSGWVLSNEQFFNISWIDRFKLFAGYGKTGNSSLENRAIRRVHSYYSSFSGGEGYDHSTGVEPVSIGNNDLGWEITREFNTGMDFLLFNKRFMGSIAAYFRKTTDLIQRKHLPLSSGFSYYFVNSGNVINSGLEINMESQNITGAIKWNTLFNLSYNQNELELEDPIYSGIYANETGHSLTSFYLYEMDRVDPETGDIIWVDQNGDGRIDESDKVIKGRTTPAWFGGLNNYFEWKGIELNVLLQFATGHQVYNQGRGMLEGMTNIYNQSVTVDERWREPGDQTDMPRAAWGDPAGNNRVSDRFLEDASYLRVKLVSLAYTFPELLKGRYFKNLKVFVSVQNLATLTGYRGHDPEIYFPENAQVETSLDYLNYPQNRIYTVGLTVQF